MAIITLLIL